MEPALGGREVGLEDHFALKWTLVESIHGAPTPAKRLHLTVGPDIFIARRHICSITWLHLKRRRFDTKKRTGGRTNRKSNGCRQCTAVNHVSDRTSRTPKPSKKGIFFYRF